MELTAVVSNITTITTTTTGTQTEPPKPMAPIVKKLPSYFCFATDGGTESFKSQIIDESFLQQFLQCRGDGGSSPKHIAIQWTLSGKRIDISATSIVRVDDDDDDHGCSTGTGTNTSRRSRTLSSKA